MLLLLLVLVPALHEFFRPHEPELGADEHIYGSDYNPEKGIFGGGYDPDEDINRSDYDPDPDEGIIGSGYDQNEGIIGSGYDPNEDINGSDYDADCVLLGVCGDEPTCTGEGERVRGEGNCTLRPDCDLFGGELCCDSGEP